MWKHIVSLLLCKQLEKNMYIAIHCTLHFESSFLHSQQEKYIDLDHLDLAEAETYIICKDKTISILTYAQTLISLYL